MKKIYIILVVLLAFAGVVVFNLIGMPTSSGNTKHSNKIIKVAAIGDSITLDSGDSPKKHDNKSYPGQLQNLLGSDYKVTNFGVDGATLVNSGDLPYRNSEFFKKYKDINPDIVLIMLGTNDSKPQNWNASEYKNQLKDFVKSIRSQTSHPHVYLLTPPAAFDNSIGINKTIIQEEIYPAVQQVAQQTGTPFVNLFSATKDHPEYFLDGVHPNVTGYGLIAQKVYISLAAKLY